MKRNRVFCTYLLGICCLQNIEAANITRLDVPKNAADSVTLNCKYALEKDDVLYAVKWFKDGHEFFRCYADGSVQEYALKDVKIYHSGRAQVGSCFFDLTQLTPRSAGEYQCEVGLDWPTFKTVEASAHLQVIEPQRIIQNQLTTLPPASVPEFKNESEIVETKFVGPSFLSGSSYVLPSITPIFLAYFITYICL